MADSEGESQPSETTEESSEPVGQRTGDATDTEGETTDGETTEDEASDNKINEPPGPRVQRDSTMSDIPLTDSVVLQQLREADSQAQRTARMIKEMKDSIGKFQKKKSLSEADAQNLEDKQSQLMKKLHEFEEITRRVQALIGLTDINSAQFEPSYTSMMQSIREEEKQQPPVTGKGPIGQVPSGKGPGGEVPADEGLKAGLEGGPCPTGMEFSKELGVQFPTPTPSCELGMEPEAVISEERLPKVIVCGIEDEVPRIIVCEAPKRDSSQKPKQLPGHKAKEDVVDCLTGLTRRLSQSYSMQEKLASENADLEGNRFSLQKELVKKDNLVDCLSKKLCSLQAEIRMMAQENACLSKCLAKFKNTNTGCNPCPQKIGNECPCPATTNQLESQLDDIECEVKGMQAEIAKVQNERKLLDSHKKLLKCTAADCPSLKCQPSSMPVGDGDQALRELKEQYARLQDDYKSKVTEVSVCRREIEKEREVSEEARNNHKSAALACRLAEEKLALLEKQTHHNAGSKEQLMEQEQQVLVWKQRFNESQDEMEDQRGMIQDQAAQLDDYRCKYLLSQQQVEEQRSQLEEAEQENTRISEQINCEISRVRNQFTEKLRELTPLPDILKAVQLKLQETQELRVIAERNCEDMAREMQEIKDKAQHYARQLDDNRTASNMSLEEKGNLQSRLESLDKKHKALKEENTEMKMAMARLEEAESQSKVRLEEKLHEVAQLLSQIETLREESARQVARTKERGECMRQTYHNQITELERQLAQSRAATHAAQRERNEIRQRMQIQINNLNDGFYEAQLRNQALQCDINVMKAPYTNIMQCTPETPNNLMITDCAPQNYKCECKHYLPC